MTADFDDASWPSAGDAGDNGVTPWHLRPDLSAEAHWIWTQDPQGHDASYCRYVSNHQTYDCPAAQARYLKDYPDVATFNIFAYQHLQPGETQETQGDWTHFPHLGVQGCDAQTSMGRAAHPQTTDADPALDGHHCHYKPNDDCETPRSSMTPDQAKAYCAAQRWCMGFEYGSESIFFKHCVSSTRIGGSGLAGSAEGAGNGLYLLGGASTEGFDHYETVRTPRKPNSLHHFMAVLWRFEPLY